MTQRWKAVPLQGGLDLVTAAMMVTPGFAIAALNYESEARGYRRMVGYERKDGQPAPSDAEYYVLGFDAGSVAIAEDDTVTGLTSGATGIAVLAGIVTSGSYGGSDAAGDLILYNVSGIFQTNEPLQVSAATRATSDGTATLAGADTDTLHVTYLAEVRTKRRAVIAKPVGSGAIRGVATYLGDTYCWRDNAGATAGDMHKATTAGWVVQTLGEYILFDTGTSAGAFVEGETLTGAGGATATIERVIRNDGSWGSDASGYLVLSGVSGGPYVNNEAITSATGAALADGINVAITLPVGGAYNSIENNFYAQEITTRLYVANGVGPAFEWDGTVLAPIFTQIASALEKPKYVAEHRKHLFLGYTGGSLQNSAIGEPLTFDALQGAAEHGFGQDLTGLKSHTRDSLIVTARNKIGYLVGSSAADFELRAISEDSGAIAGTLENVGQPIFMDDQGVRDMTAAQTYGDWTIGTITRLVEPLLKTKRAAGVTPVGAIRVRAKDQYRLFFSDGSALVIYFGRKKPEIMPITVSFTPTCFASGEDGSGNEILLAGASDGWVYELDKGISFDGANIEAFLRTSFLNQGKPNYEKRYHRARLEGQAGVNNSAIKVVADFGYGNPNQPPSGESSFIFYGGGGFWDEAFWDEFNWDSAVEGQAFADLAGIGENVSVTFISDTAAEEPHTLSTLTIYYTDRKMLR